MMEWEEHLRDMAQTAVEHPEYKMMAWFTARDAVAEIDRLRAEIDRLRAELKGREEEVERLRDAIADSHDELLQKFDSNAVGHTDLYTWIKCQVAKIKRLESIAASRLADQEYKKVIDDALVVANIGSATGDAKADVHKLICWEIDVALDPRVSKRAADLIRLADQEAIERHTAKRVAREILLIMDGSESYEDAVSEIRKKYGVD